MALAAMMVAAPMVVSAHCGTCGTDAKQSEKKSCCPAAKTCDAKKTCTKEESKDCSKCPKKAACTKEGCKDGCKCPKEAAAKTAQDKVEK